VNYVELSTDDKTNNKKSMYRYRSATNSFERRQYNCCRWSSPLQRPIDDETIELGDAARLAAAAPGSLIYRIIAQKSLGSSRLDMFDMFERVEPCCSNMVDDEQAIVLACTSLVFFMLLHTHILFVPSNKIK